jgi:hypothetical protein
MAKSSRQMSCAYIDTKGTLVVYFDEFRHGHKIGETVDIHYAYCKLWMTPAEDRHTMYGAPGRIILPRYGHSAVVRLAKGGRFECRMAALSNGSENTRNAGIAVQYIQLRLANNETIEWHDTPGLMSPGIVIQQGEEYLTRAGHRAGHRLTENDSPVINKVTGVHPDDAAKSEVA